VRFLAAYRRLFAIPGTVAFWTMALIGRLPLSMVGLGYVLLVQHVTGSYGVAGTVSAAYTITFAVGAVVHGRLIDRLGQGMVLRITGILFGVAVALTTMAAQLEWPRALVYVLAAISGATVPQNGSAVRARWTYLLSDRHDRHTAFALESMADETVYIVGPVLATVLATSIHPAIGLLLAAVVGLAGTVAFSLLRSTEPPVDPTHHEHGMRPPIGWRAMGALGLVAASFGMAFGGYEVTTVAFAREHGHPGLGGVLLALSSVGSLVAGLVIGTIRWRQTPTTRLRIATAAFAVSLVPLCFIHSLWLLGAVMLLGGLTIAPGMVGLSAFTESAVPPSRLTEGMALIGTGIVAGVAPGSAVTGYVIDNHGASAAFIVVAAAAFAGAIVTFLLPPTRAAAD